MRGGLAGSGGVGRLETPMKPPIKRLSDLKGSGSKGSGPKGSGSRQPATYAPPTPKVSRQQRAKVLTPAERAAFLASRPDLKPKG